MLRRLPFLFICYVLLLCYALVFPPRASAAVKLQTIPSPFFFTENKGQWDSRVLYKCQAKNGMTWFLERDGITLLVSRELGTGNGEQEKMRGRDILVADNDPVHRTFLSDDPLERDLPEMLRRHPRGKYPMKSHALKFHFVKGEGSKVNGEREATDSILHLPPSTVLQHKVLKRMVNYPGRIIIS